MARYSNTAQMVKVEDGDIVSVMGVKGKVVSVTVLPSVQYNGTMHWAVAMVEVDFSRGTGDSNFVNYSEIDGIGVGSEWWGRDGKVVQV